MFDRRRFMTGMAASVVVAGWDPLHLQWVSHAQAPACLLFDQVGPLDGTLVMDTASLNDDSRDEGNMVERRPCAVLHPGSVEDIRKLILFCRQHKIKVAARGQGHTTFGQGLVTGLIVETKWLNAIHSIGPEGADVQSGVRWRDLVTEAFTRHRLRAYGLTGYTALSVGGTLSVGGVSTAYLEGGQVDRVLELDVVTGAGELLTCSTTQHSDLFESMLGGLGQCGIITRVKLAMAPARPLVRNYQITYLSSGSFFRDIRLLLNRGEVDEIFNLWLPYGTTIAYQLNVRKHFDPSQPPDDTQLLRGLGLESLTAVKLDLPYLDAAFLFDVIIDRFKLAGWDRLIKPWFDVWLPGDTIEQYVRDVIPSLTPADWSPTGFHLLIPHRRTNFTRPFFRVPQSSDGLVFLFDLLNDSVIPAPILDFSARMLARNRRLFDRAQQLGGLRYPIGSIEFSKTDWINHYGNTWALFEQRKRTYDPDNILTPGPGIF